MNSVIVVGAGPVGVVAALALRNRGLDVTVIETEPENRIRPGSRAIFLMNPTLRRLEAVETGLGRAIAHEGIQLRGVDCRYAGRKVFSAPFPRLAPMWAPGVSLPQRVTEELVYDAAARNGVLFRWGATVTDVVTDAGGVTVSVDGVETMADYVVAADGARSVVRQALGLSLEGPRDSTPFIIVDVAARKDGSTERSRGFFHYLSPEAGGRNVMHMPFAGGMRIDLQCLPEDDAEHLASPDGLRKWIVPVIGEWYADHVDWVSTYLFHQAVADSFTDPHRRVVLAGEAAHLFAPWGGRGLNSGVIDATDAAAAIRRAVDDPDRAAQHIQACADDRRGWALHNRGISSRALARMRSEHPVASRVAPYFPPVGAWLANGPTQAPVMWPWARSVY